MKCDDILYDFDRTRQSLAFPARLRNERSCLNLKDRSLNKLVSNSIPFLIIITICNM